MSLNWRIYKILNPDLKFGTQIEYERHYLEYGKRERRPCSIYSFYPDFDYKQYQLNYVDLKYYNKPDLEVHWISVGSKEYRTYKRVLKWIYIIDGVKLGGTKKYIEDLVKYYGINIRLLSCKLDLSKYNINTYDVVLVQQLAFTNITPIDLLEFKKVRNPKIFIILHDFSWLNKNIYNTGNNIQHICYTNPNNDVIDPVRVLFNTVEAIICPSKFIYDEYSKKISNKRLIIAPHTDYKCDMNRILVPKVTNTINIGVFHTISEVKGSEYVSYLMTKYKDFNGKHIKYYVVGVTIGNYNEDEYFKLLTKYNIHGLLLLNKYGEAWCYLLTKYLFSGLPILYNNIGSFRERITPLENRFSVGELDGRIDVDRLNKGYKDMLNYIIDNGREGKRVWVDGAKLEKPEFYVNLFNKSAVLP
jgi:hypothetical protein